MVFYKYRKYSPLKLRNIITLLNECLDMFFCTPSTSSPFLILLRTAIVLLAWTSEVASVEKNLHFIFKEKVLLHNSIISFTVLVRAFSVLKSMPEIVIFVQTFPHLSPARLINICYFETGLGFHYSNRYLFGLWEFNYNLFDEILISLSRNLYLNLGLLSLFVLEGLNKWFRGDYFHEFVRKIGNFICLNVFLNHSCKFNYLVSAFLLLILNLPCNF